MTESVETQAPKWSRMRLFIPLGLFVLLSVLMFVGLKLDPNDLPSVVINRPVPAFSLPSLEQPDQTLTEQAFAKGKPYLLNVWATWCPGCKYEHPFLLELAKMGIAIYGVNYQDDLPAARALLERDGNPYLANVADETGELILSLGVTGAPETFVVDAEGIIRDRIVGILNQQVWTGQLAQYFIGE